MTVGSDTLVACGLGFRETPSTSAHFFLSKYTDLDRLLYVSVPPFL